ncbi:MAG: transglycosylase domain-containing protein, partial [Clostridia bacterium]|nr:transglycosylase domain-containing protein [Clostridia bacterium]
MSRRKELKKGCARVTVWVVLTVLVLTVGMAVLGTGIFIHARFQREIPTELFRFSMNGQLPRFYVYRFESRVDRVGIREELPTGYFAQTQSSYVSDSQLPDLLKHAFISIEDKRFYRHHGVDWYRTVAAGCNFVLGFSDSFGASTITQQLVKNVTGSSEVTLSRKMQEILYALDLERKMDKSEILERYLNVIHFSDRCDGIGDAAMHYFSKSPAELTAAECASLAAIANSPSYYNPIRHPKNNLARRNLILTAMRDQGYLDQSSYEEAIQSPLEICETAVAGEGINSWYTDMVIEDVIEDLMREYHLERAAASRLVFLGGLQIDVAMDPEVQNKVEEFYRTAVKVPSNEDGMRAQSALIVLDSRTGDILGVAGAVGNKTANRVQNFATQTLRPPGSTIKPVTVYAPALEKGIIDWATVYDDVPVRFDAGGKAAWPKNATGVYRGLTNVAYAVAHSTNTVAVKILEQVGLHSSYRFAKEGFRLHSLISDSRGNDCDL